MSRYLLDTNLLIALAWPQHIHHSSAHRWFGSTGRKAWATCPITQLGFIRISSNRKIIPSAVSPNEAAAMMRRVLALDAHQFWGDDLEPTTVEEFSAVGLTGHRQVTDAYLLALAKHRDGRLATFDRGIANLLEDPNARAQYIEQIRPD